MSNNPKYYKGLSEKQKKEKKKNLKKSNKLYTSGKKKQALKLAKKRPTTKQNKKSPFTEQFKKKFPDTKPLTKKFEEKTGIPMKAQKKIYTRGKGAWVSAGSRPSVGNPSQWGYARLYAFYIKLKNKKLNFDKDIVKEYNIKVK